MFPSFRKFLYSNYLRITIIVVGSFWYSYFILDYFSGDDMASGMAALFLWPLMAGIAFLLFAYIDSKLWGVKSSIKNPNKSYRVLFWIGSLFIAWLITVVLQSLGKG